MSVILNFAIFPTDKGASVSEYVSKVIEMIRNSGVPYQLNPMGTSIETETLEQGLQLVNQAHELLSEHSDRIYCTLTIDSRKSPLGRMQGKINAIESKIGKVNH
jgi:uncharacterized protein (TIGR00106 family)